MRLDNKGNLFPGMVGEYRNGEEEEREIEDMCRFHKFELSMSKRPVPYAED